MSEGERFDPFARVSAPTPAPFISSLPPEIKAAASRGWRLFPVEAEGKQPLVKEWQTIATSDLARLEAWAEIGRASCRERVWR